MGSIPTQVLRFISLKKKNLGTYIQVLQLILLTTSVHTSIHELHDNSHQLFNFIHVPYSRKFSWDKIFAKPSYLCIVVFFEG